VFVCILPEKAVPEMTYTVLGGTLNTTHSLTHLTWKHDSWVGLCRRRQLAIKWPITHAVNHFVKDFISILHINTSVLLQHRKLFCIGCTTVAVAQIQQLAAILYLLKCNTIEVYNIPRSVSYKLKLTPLSKINDFWNLKKRHVLSFVT